MPRPRKFDEQAVIAAARARFWRDGYAGTSIQDLSDATALGTQSIYGAFGNKHDLFIRILDDYCARQSAGLEGAITADPSPWHGLTSAVIFEDGGRMDLPPQGCLMANSAAALSDRDDEVRTRACRAYADTLALFTRQLIEAQKCGEVDAAVDPEQTARALIAVMQGIEALHKSGIGEGELRRAKEAAVQLIDAALAR